MLQSNATFGVWMIVIYIRLVESMLFLWVFLKIYLVFGVETSNLYCVVRGCYRAFEFAVNQRTN
jgi:hypothetical protein